MDVIDIAGNFVLNSGKTLDPIFTRLKKEDPNTEGLKMELHGGKHKFGNLLKKQRAVITLLCDRERTGLEGLEEPKPDGDKKKDGEKKDGDKKDNKDKEGKSKRDDEENKKSLVFKSYNEEEGTLDLGWRTKYACENVEDGGSAPSGHWGFFTWVIVLYVVLVSLPLSSETNAQCHSQSVPVHFGLSDIRLVAQLQPLWSSRVGLASSQ